MATDLLPMQGVTLQSEPAAGRRAIYILWSLFWTLMIVVSIQDHVHAGGARLWEPLLWEGTSAAGATLWFALQRRVSHRYDQHLGEPLRWFAEHLKWLPLIVVTFVGGVYAVRHGVYYLVGEQYAHETWGFVVVYESIKLVLFAGLWLGILFGFSSFAQWRRERQRLALLQRSLAEAQLSQLKAQLRPHFLFNALNTISALMHTDVNRADRLLAQLSDLLRSTLQSGDRDRIALREELRLLELYAQIMQERFVDRVALEWSIAPEACDASVPVLLLQPLLENAFKHGVEKSRERVHIEIRAERQGGELHLLVRNSGALQPDGAGVGLRNCRERLLVMYGEAAILTLTQDANYVAARAVLPFQEYVG